MEYVIVYLLISLLAGRVAYRRDGMITGVKTDAEKYAIAMMIGVTWPLWIVYRFVTGHW